MRIHYWFVQWGKFCLQYNQEKHNSDANFDSLLHKKGHWQVTKVPKTKRNKESHEIIRFWNACFLFWCHTFSKKAFLRVLTCLSQLKQWTGYIGRDSWNPILQDTISLHKAMNKVSRTNEALVYTLLCFIWQSIVEEPDWKSISLEAVPIDLGKQNTTGSTGKWFSGGISWGSCKASTHPDCKWGLIRPLYWFQETWFFLQGVFPLWHSFSFNF